MADPRITALPATRGQRPQTPNLCPFGCGPADLSPHGYCRHLVGWTTDGQAVELRETVEELHYERCGAKTGRVEAADVVVPMKTVSARVYRPGAGDRRVEKPADQITQNVDALQELVAAQAAQLAAQQAQIDQLLAAVGGGKRAKQPATADA